MNDFKNLDNNRSLVLEDYRQNRFDEEAKKNFNEIVIEKSPKRKELKMTEEEKEINRKILQNMNRKLNFKRNPRFKNKNKCMLYSNALFSEILHKDNPYVVEPMIVIFREYHINSVYKIDVKLTNRIQTLTSFKYIPPLTENFSIKNIIYPKKDISLIAPGMHAKIEILFNATSLDSFEDEISIITEFFAFKIPLRAIREKPLLTLENPMECGNCLLGDQISMVFRCKNSGGDAHFKFNVEDDNFYLGEKGYSNYNNSHSGNQTTYAVDNEVLMVNPFSIFPQEFYLYKGMALEIYVNFSPNVEGIIQKNLYITCDSKENIPYKIQGEGIAVDFQLISIDELIIDESFEKIQNLYFEDTYPSTSNSRKIKIKNLSKVSLNFHWNIYDIYENSQNILNENGNDFSVFPENGAFKPLEEILFRIDFNPKNCKIYEQRLDLIIEDVPFKAVKNYTNTHQDNFSPNNNIKLAKNTFTKGEPFMLALNSPYPSYPIFSFNLIGKGKQTILDADTKIIDLGDVYLGEKIKRKFNLINNKSGFVRFKIDKIIQGMWRENNEEYNIVNSYFCPKNHRDSNTDHFRTECIFKKKSKLSNQILEIFEKSEKKRNAFFNYANRANNLADRAENSRYNQNQSENNTKKRDEKANFNTSKIDKNESSKQIKFLKLSSQKENFSNKDILRENSKRIENIPTRISLNKSSKFINDKLSVSNADNVSNSIENNIIIKRPESIVTNKSTNLNLNKQNLKNFPLVNNKNSLESIKENEKLEYNNKARNLLLKPLTKSVVLKNINSKASLRSSIETLDLPLQKVKSFKIMNTQAEQKLNLKNSLYSQSTNSYQSRELIDNKEIEINETDDLIIKKDQNVEIAITFIPEMLGLYKCSCIVKGEDSIPFSIDVKANVIGPKLKIDTPLVNFGLFPVNEIRIAKFKLINFSRVPAKFLIKESRFKNIYFNNFESSGYLQDTQGIITEPKSRNKIENIIDLRNKNTRVMDINVRDNYEVKFFPLNGTLKENGEVEIIVSFVSAYPKLLVDQIEVLIENSDSFFINVFADCQEAFAYIDKVFINPSSIYVGVPVKYQNNQVRIFNPSNLPINYEWENVYDQDEKIIEFFPNKGSIKPRSYVEIFYKMTFFIMKNLDEIFICKIAQMDVPLGVNVRGVVTGLDIIYEYTDQSFNQMNFLSRLETTSIHSAITSNSLIRKTLTLKSNKRFSNSDSLKLDKTLKLIDIKNLKVNKHHSFSFIIKNLSGIPTSFYFTSKNFHPGKEKDIKYEILAQTSLSSLEKIEKGSNDIRNFEKNNSAVTQNSIKDIYNSIANFNPSTNRNMKSLNGLRKSYLNKSSFGNSSTGIICHELLNDLHEQIIFTSPKGIEHTKFKQIEKESHMFLSNQKGVALVIEPKEGKLDPYSEVIVNISIYNECVGDFEDELISRVKGLPEKKFPVSLRIRGNPLQMAPNQTGLNYQEEPPILNIGNVITKINQIQKSFKIINTGANLILINWKIFDYEKIDNKDIDRNIFNIKIAESKGNFSLKYIPCEPEELNKYDDSFVIEPQNQLIQPKNSLDFKITFKANSSGLRNALFMAYPKFMDNNSTSNLGLSELALKVEARGISPLLYVDKKINFNGKYIYKFYLHSYGISPKPKKSIVLINKERVNLIIKLIIEGPYKIIKTEPLESTIGNSVYNINPKSNLKVEIKPFIPDSNNYEEWPKNLVNEKNGRLIYIFENGEFQEYHLITVLKRPRLTLSTSGSDAIESDSIIDFGAVNCESYKKSVIYIKNETDVNSDWSIKYHKPIPKKYHGYGIITKAEQEDIEMLDDPDVFLFSLTNGVIPGPSLPLMNIPLGPCLPKIDNEERDKLLPVKIEIMFKPKKNVFYKCRYKIITSTGNSIDFILKGHGSYKEEELQ